METNLTYVSKILFRNARDTYSAISNKVKINDMLTDVCSNLIQMDLFDSLHTAYFSLNMADISLNSLNVTDLSGANNAYSANDGNLYFDLNTPNINLLTNHTNFSFNNIVGSENIKLSFDIYSEIAISENFILKLARRVRAMTQIYVNKPNVYCDSMPDGFTNIYTHWGITKPEIKFLFFLQRNPRKTSKDIGLANLQRLKDSRCFNCSSALTVQEETDKPNLGLYRENEIFGLLTHELMHFCNLDGLKSGFTEKIYDVTDFKLNNAEIFANSFASIYHSIFNSFELDTTVTVEKKYGIFLELLLFEIVHSFIQLVRLSRILGNKTWTDFKASHVPFGNANSYMFSYILGRALFFINLNLIIRNCSIDTSPNNLTYNGPDNCLQNILKNTMETDQPDNDTFLNNIFEIVNKTLDKGNDNSEEICGNMIMEYFAIDFGDADKDSVYNTMPLLYGGNKDKFYLKYLKYKAKYLKLKNNS